MWVTYVLSLVFKEWVKQKSQRESLQGNLSVLKSTENRYESIGY